MLRTIEKWRKILAHVSTALLDFPPTIDEEG